jgi:DNA-binding transcriptional LysR family regulator
MTPRDLPFDLNLLRVLLALDRTRHVTRAAELLNMSQSGFSSALARLRRHCGDELFVRTPRGMVETPQARRFIEVASAATAAVEQQLLAGRAFDPATVRTEFRLGMTDVAEIVFLPRLLDHLERVAPHTTVRCDSLPKESIQQALGDGAADLAMGYFPDLAAQTFYHQRLYRHTFACIVRRGHPLESGQMTAHAFSRLGHVVVTSPSRSARLLESWLKSKRIERNVVLRTPHHLSLPAIIEATDLVGTVPLAVAVWFAQHGAGASSTAAVEACHICGGCFVREITADPKLIASCSHTPQFVLNCN